MTDTATKTGWDLVYLAGRHFDRAIDAHDDGDNEAAEDEFDKACQVLAEARHAFLNEIIEQNYLNQCEE
jgi:hypothetical protein